MPYPRWLARFNKRLLNPREIRREKYPIVTHLGRVSGRPYRTPLDAFPTEAGYVLVARYGPNSDWVRNILAAGTATLRVRGEDHALDSPRLVSQQEAVEALTSDEQPAHFTKAASYLLMDHST
jgi:deazaflavin-dependent oxidoreductase (nitroreductase family)